MDTVFRYIQKNHDKMEKLWCEMFQRTDLRGAVWCYLEIGGYNGRQDILKVIVFVEQGLELSCEAICGCVLMRKK